MDAIPGVLDAFTVRGARAAVDAAPELLIEVPHGATQTADFRALEARLTSPLPADLVDFFHVNTDAGAPELARAVAERFVAAEPERSATVIRCRIPRTFIDTNRRIDATPDEFEAGKVTPGLMPWIVTPEDQALLRGLYEAYVGAVSRAVARVPADGAVLLLHTYAPRSVDVRVDHAIVPSLRRAYAPEVEPTWPLRPPLDVIGRGADGTAYAPAEVVAALRELLAPLGLPVADSATYPLHPSTMAWAHTQARPGRTLCLEVRRDLLADPFTPFAQMEISGAQVARLAEPLTQALRRWW